MIAPAPVVSPANLGATRTPRRPPGRQAEAAARARHPTADEKGWVTGGSGGRDRLQDCGADMTEDGTTMAELGLTEGWDRWHD